MYMNNRAARAMLRGQLDDAYWWAREAIVQSPGYLNPYKTLGVIYGRHGERARAEAVFEHVLAREPANTRACPIWSLAQAGGPGGEAANSSSACAARARPAVPLFQPAWRRCSATISGRRVRCSPRK